MSRKKRSFERTFYFWSNYKSNYNLVFVTIIKKIAEKNIFGKVKRVNEVQGVVNYDAILESGDILVLYGENENIKKFIREMN